MIILPLFPETEIQLAGLWVTKRQLQKTIMALFPDVVERSRIHSTFNISTGEIDRKYAWNAIYNDLNKSGLAEQVINSITADVE